jgi:hypothetical protein
MPDHALSNARYLRERAREFRSKAEHQRDDDSKRLMLNLAESYELLARRAEERSETSDGA